MTLERGRKVEAFAIGQYVVVDDKLHIHLFADRRGAHVLTTGWRIYRVVPRRALTAYRDASGGAVCTSGYQA